MKSTLILTELDRILIRSPQPEVGVEEWQRLDERLYKDQSGLRAKPNTSHKRRAGKAKPNASLKRLAALSPRQRSMALAGLEFEMGKTF